MTGPGGAPTRVAVVGAGMVGLSTAWFLQEHGVEVVVLERRDVGSGASWANAGWLTPSLATPLPEPAVLRYGLRMLVQPSSPVYVPPTADPALISFLTRFARNSTASRWRAAMAAMVPINRRALPAYDRVHAGGVAARTRSADPFLAAYRTESERRVLVEEIEHIRAAGQEVRFELLDGATARSIEPALSDEVGAAIRIDGQQYIDPAQFVQALADAVRSRGGLIRTGVDVLAVRAAGSGAQVRTCPGGIEQYDAIVLAPGAWSGELARSAGVRTAVQAGRGYSFSCTPDQIPANPVYFPAQRVACTPLGDRLRVAGMMEFRPADARFDPRRIDALVAAATPLLRGGDLSRRTDEWVGPRPVTPDGLPLIGATAAAGVYLAGGHGMWGITLGPATGELLAELVVTGRTPPELAPFDPLR